MGRIRASLVLMAWIAAGLAGPDSAWAADPVSFRREVAPLLVGRCLGCHNDEKTEAALNLKTFALLRAGGVTLGAGIVEPGDPEASHLIAVLKPDANPRMPLQQAPLSEPEIALLERWVREGATFDGGSETETLLTSLVDPLANLPKVSPRRPVHPPIKALAVAPGGQRLAIGRGCECLVLDAKTGRTEATFRDFEGPVQALVFSADGHKLVVAGGRPGQFGSIVVWDLTSGTKIQSFRGHADAILAIAIGPDGKTLATASYDRLVKLWNLDDGKEIRTLKEHTDAVYAVAFSPNGVRLASAAGDRTVKVWDVASGQKEISLSDATGEEYAVLFAPDDGNRLIAAGVDKTIRAWRLQGQTATLEQTAYAHEGAVTRLVALPGSNLLASAGEDRRVKLWDLLSLEPKVASAPLADLPLALGAISEGPTFLAGLYDGSVIQFDGELKPIGTPLNHDAPRDAAINRTSARVDDAKPAEARKPELVRNAGLGAPSPRGAMRGSTVVLKLNGQGVGQATAIQFSAPGLVAKLKPREPADPNAIDAELTIAPDAPTGTHRFWVRTPLGTPGPQMFVVSAEPETLEIEPNDTPDKATQAPLPSTLVGMIEKPGEIDQFQFHTVRGQTLVFELLARPLGSALNGVLELRDEQGSILASATRTDDGREPVLVHSVQSDGIVRLRVVDADLGGSGAHFYRIRVGSSPYLTSVWPLAMEIKPAQPAEKLKLEGFGVNLPSDRVALPGTEGLKPGVVIPVPTLGVPGSEDWAGVNPRKIVAVEGPVVLEREPNEAPAAATPISTPGGFSGRIEPAGDVDHVRFEAKGGERWVIEVHGRRLGSPIDPAIEILDANGHSIPRAVLRPVRETTVAFRDHNSSGKSIRLTWPWTGFEQGDHVLIGQELLRIQELPRSPDDDAVFWGTGGTRFSQGERMAFLGTTPEHHAVGQTISKVEIHPPGAHFPAGGSLPVTLTYRNDDGGPGLDKDPWLLFEAPADGNYIVRVEDIRGLGGPDVGYHLSVRKPQPDYRLSLASSTPNIPRGAGVFVPVNLERIDGFRGAVEVSVQGLPAGIRAVPTVIEKDEYTADLLFVADHDAPAILDPGPWRVVGRALGNLDSETHSDSTVELPWAQDHPWSAGAAASWISVAQEPNVTIRPSAQVVRIKPGQDVTLNLAIERRNGFAGRVPIDVRNLPSGVAVQNIGLNGVLVTEKITERSITLHAEPWVKPQSRAFFAVAKCEAAGTEAASVPIVLEVE